MPDLIAEAALAQDIGRRSRQEDAVIAHFCQRDDLGIAVLSDGMGGHEDGDLASRILAGEMFGELLLSSARRPLLRANAPEIFGAALNSANRRLQRHIEAGHIRKDTGGTLTSVMILGGELRWISVGDSPLYLLRGHRFLRLNEDHSMAPQIDLMVENGELDAEAARDHADRNCLTSAVTGRNIPRIDCPAEAIPLAAGDMLILASDGVNVLEDEQIGAIALRFRARGSRAVADALLDTVLRQEAPEQDNTSLVVIQVKRAPATQGVIARMAQAFGGGMHEQRRGLAGARRAGS